jgi:hypothetical protein
VFGECVRASELFEQHNVLHDVEGGVQVEWARHANGGPTPPNEGDIIIYPFVESKIPWGHVGVISHMHWLPSPIGTGRDGTGQCVAIAGIAEQNIHARHWNGRSYGRCIALIKRTFDAQPPSFTLEEHETAIFEDCLGWKPVRLRLFFQSKSVTFLQVPASYPVRSIDQPLRPLHPAKAPATGTHAQFIRIEPPLQPRQQDNISALTAAALERQDLRFSADACSRTRPTLIWHHLCNHFKHQRTYQPHCLHYSFLFI